MRLVLSPSPRYSGTRSSRNPDVVVRARRATARTRLPSMKRIAIFAAVFVFILLLTKIADQVPPEPPAGTAFSLKAQQVVECTPTEITLVNVHALETHLDKDSSWPACTAFNKDDVLDFYLSRGAATRFLSCEKTAWWRKVM